VANVYPAEPDAEPSGVKDVAALHVALAMLVPLAEDGNEVNEQLYCSLAVELC